MKKLINRPEAVVEEMVEGLVALYPGLRRLQGHAVLLRADIEEVREQRVAVISGGGSGHEPAHAGYVGRGMLSAAVAGDVFTSPSPDAILAAIRAAAGPRGALLIVKNYTGDRLNFGLAAEWARVEGIPVEMVLVADDVALADATETAGRRGIAGTVLVHKIAGAAAEAGATLAAVAAEARAAAADVWTMGVALSPCTVPAAGRPGFVLGEDEIELGLGIHGEPGVRRGPIEPADPLVDRLLGAILAEARLQAGERVALLVNNLGGTPTMELAIVARRAIAALEAAGLAVVRGYAGAFLTALEMAGVSLSVLRVDYRRLARLDAPTEAPAWPNAANRPRARSAEPIPIAASTEPRPLPGPPRTALGLRMREAIEVAARALIQAAPELTELDRFVGDGDLGISLARGAEALREALPSFPWDDPAETLNALGRTFQRAVGGTSGPLYAVFFLRAAERLRTGPVTDPLTWAAAFQEGGRGVADLGGAAPGDRTMLDALIPATAAFEAGLRAGKSPTEALRGAAAAAHE
ncbi:MAG: dihydroxyacetone kinase subunit DhaK, partial [Isosphaeraceae bacterium]|nr:dihydroxyacetone kinase subunit DhaK [Isosphaeraceae bacterium]